MKTELRYDLADDDEAKVRALVTSTGFFSLAEVDIAVELVAERRQRGDASGYHFVFLEADGGLLGYTCYGPIPATASSFDLYWIAVDKSRQRRGSGRGLLTQTETAIRNLGGTRIYLDTSSRAAYAPTRAFYLACGYSVAAELDDFYGPGDGKIIFCKVLR